MHMFLNFNEISTKVNVLTLTLDIINQMKMKQLLNLQVLGKHAFPYTW
jgi:hypothetical protein